MSEASARMTINELSERLALSKPTIYRMLEDRQLPGIRSGRLWIVARRAFEEWERTCGMGRLQ